MQNNSNLEKRLKLNRIHKTIIVAIFVCLLILSFVFAILPVLAETEEDDSAQNQFSYSVISEADKTVRITDAEVITDEVRIPSSIDDYTITEIGEKSFSDSTKMEFVIFPDTIERIGKEAFSGCTNLSNVCLNKGLEEIGENAFDNCPSIDEIYIPKTVSTIGEHAIGFTRDEMFDNNNTWWYQDLLIKGFHGTAAEQYAERDGFGFEALDGNPRVFHFTYEVLDENDKTATVTGLARFDRYDEYFPDDDKDYGLYYYLEIPKTINGYSIVKIGEKAFYNSAFENVIIPEGVTSIGEGAFSWSSLESVIIPEGVTSIGEEAFSRSNLKSVTLPDSIISIGKNAFYYSDIATITLPSNITSISDGTFCGCHNLRSISIPDGLTTIGEDAFDGCAFETITLPDTVISIGMGAFDDCDELKSIKLPDGVLIIPPHCFYDCTSLESVALPENIKTISEQAFRNCAIKSITFPESIETIGQSAFYQCDKLEGISFPEQTNSNSGIKIGGGAFSRCSSIKEIVFPDTVSSIGMRGFDYCDSLESVSLPDNGLSIDAAAFLDCPNLKEVTIPASINEIGSVAFGYYERLLTDEEKEEAGIPLDDSTWIDVPYEGFVIKGYRGTAANTYADDFSLEFIALDEGDDPEEPEEDSFYYDVISETDKTARLTHANITSNVVNIPSEIDGYTIIEIGKGALVRRSFEEVIIPDSVTTIGEAAFYQCQSLKNISIPFSVTSIEGNAFAGCMALESITLPDGVTSIEPGAFQLCTSLNNVSLTDSVTSIGDVAFYGCSALETISLPEGLESIGMGSFAVCSNLESIDIPESVNTIGSAAFFGCRSLKSITIPDGITTIESQTFDSCASLEHVSLPDSITTIEISAFLDCPQLKEITIPASVTSIGNRSLGYYYDSSVSSYIPMEGFTIKGYRGTEAEKYAKDNGFIFIALDEVPVEPMSAYIESSKGFDLKSKTYTKLSVNMVNGNLEDYTYRFYVYNLTTNQGYLLKESGHESEFLWYTGPVGVKTLYVDIIDDEGDITRIFKNDVNVTESDLTVSSFTSSEGTEVVAKTYTTLTAEAQNGTSPYEYKFIVHNERTGEWYKIQDFSSKNSAKWYTAGADHKTLYVDVRDAEGIVVRQGIEVTVK